MDDIKPSAQLQRWFDAMNALEIGYPISEAQRRRWETDFAENVSTYDALSIDELRVLATAVQYFGAFLSDASVPFATRLTIGDAEEALQTLIVEALVHKGLISE